MEMIDWSSAGTSAHWLARMHRHSGINRAFYDPAYGFADIEFKKATYYDRHFFLEHAGLRG